MTGPGPDRTPPGSDPEPATPSEPPALDGPPGGGIFTLEGRRAPGLYLVAWLLSVGGLVLAFLIGPMASGETARPILVGIGFLALTLGFAAGAGSQVLERSGRNLDRYRGPAPLLVFGAYFFAMSLVGLVLIVGLGADPDRPFSFLAIGVVQAAGYVLAVWLFAVRTDALAWRQMGWPTWQGSRLSESLRGIGVAAVVMLPVTFGLLILGGIVGLLLGVDAPQVLPQPETARDGFFVVLAAALIIPIGEELFFRGFALTAWLRDLGPRAALIRSSLFFALVHIANISGVGFVEGLSQAVLLFVVLLPVAFVFGWLFLRHGMAAAIGGHVTYNSLLLLLAYLASKLPAPA
ncbi:MAG: type II CAAX endopeptidase family protein [Chloroflexota bacterium]|nr:type II CAAX endopeptidase family protein [Chloroflexota bacterium]